MIHEFTHAYDYFRGVYSMYSESTFTNSTENSAINAERSYYMSFKSNTFMKNLIEGCNSYQVRFQSANSIPWKSPFIGRVAFR